MASKEQEQETKTQDLPEKKVEDLPEVKVGLETLLTFLHQSVSCLADPSEAESVMNAFATEIEYELNVPREDLEKVFDTLGYTLYDNEDDSSEEVEYGNCGFRCDGHCQTCDPGYVDRMRYGCYDGADEI